MSAQPTQAVYFLHLMMPSVTCLGLSDGRIICHITYIPFSIWYAYLPYWSPGSTSTAAYWFSYAISDTTENLGSSCTECIAQGKDFELILTVRMETRNPV